MRILQSKLTALTWKGPGDAKEDLVQIYCPPGFNAQQYFQGADTGNVYRLDRDPYCWYLMQATGLPSVKE